MRKRIRAAQNKGDHHAFNLDDSTSRLPDDLLVSVLSSLPLKDAAVTSKIARRWRYMWSQILRLDFEDNERLNKIAANPKSCVPERTKYINWVNRVIRQHKSPTIDEFRICFDLDKYSRGAITKWIEFAISKRVVKLELDLMEHSEIIGDPGRNYVFPNKIFERKSRSRKSLNVPSKPSANVMEMKFLKFLMLKSVNVNDEALAKILTNCSVLEHLSIQDSGHLVNVNISGQSLALRSLEIVFCFGLQSIDIHDSNLSWFNYLGFPITLKLNNLPRLESVSIGEDRLWMENNLFTQISSCVPYLRVLALNIHRPEENTQLHSVPELPQLTELILTIGAWEDDSLLGWVSLIKACPKLQKFVTQLIWMKPVKTGREVRQVAKHHHQHLEVVVIAGYYGRTSDLELALHFMENGGALKKMVIDPSYQVEKRTSVAGDESLEEENAARTCAQQQLTPRTPEGIKLVIL